MYIRGLIPRGEGGGVGDGWSQNQYLRNWLEPYLFAHPDTGFLATNFIHSEHHLLFHAKNHSGKSATIRESNHGSGVW